MNLKKHKGQQITLCLNSPVSYVHEKDGDKRYQNVNRKSFNKKSDGILESNILQGKVIDVDNNSLVLEVIYAKRVLTYDIPDSSIVYIVTSDLTNEEKEKAKEKGKVNEQR